MGLIGQEQTERLSERHFKGSYSKRMFENEPGVAVFYYPKPYKRTYRTLRIPESVAKRVYQRSLVLMKPLCGKERSSFYGSFQPFLTWFSNWSWRSLTQGAQCFSVTFTERWPSRTETDSMGTPSLRSSTANVSRKRCECPLVMTAINRQHRGSTPLKNRRPLQHTVYGVVYAKARFSTSADINSFYMCKLRMAERAGFEPAWE